MKKKYSKAREFQELNFTMKWNGINVIALYYHNHELTYAQTFDKSILNEFDAITLEEKLKSLFKQNLENYTNEINDNSMNNTKNCLRCNKEFAKNRGIEKIYCSVSCRNKSALERV